MSFLTSIRTIIPKTTSSTLFKSTSTTTLRTFTTTNTTMSGKNPGNVIGGHKATLNNPNQSDEAKAHSQRVLDEQFDGGDTGAHSTAGTQGGGEKNMGNVVGGYKATLKNPRVGEEAKEHAKEKLDEMGVDYESK